MQFGQSNISVLKYKKRGGGVHLDIVHIEAYFSMKERKKSPCKQCCEHFYAGFWTYSYKIKLFVHFIN